jgi:glycosyltransferase involved in cell wall biosynthesis
MRVAIVHEWFTKLGGSEKVVAATLEMFPDAPVYALVHDPVATRGTIFEKHPIRTSFIQDLPGAVGHYRKYLPLMPMAVEQFDLSQFDVVISSNHAVAKGVLTRADQLHISYVHTPARYAWDLYHEHESGLSSWFTRMAARWTLHKFRQWDVLSANRVDRFVANSQCVANRIRKTYRRRATVIYPPVEVEKFSGTARQREDFYLVVSRLVPYKRVDLIVAVFAGLDIPLVVIGDGPELDRLRAARSSNIQVMGHQSDDAVIEYMQRCRALIVAADEDFGITTVEAQAAGAPVIAYARGGSREIVVPDVSGILFDEQTGTSLLAAVREMETRFTSFNSSQISANVQRFSKSRFQAEFRALLDRTYGSGMRK